MQPQTTRAKQHLTRQDFTLYPAAAAVCTRILAPQLLANPDHAWVVLFDHESAQWTASLLDSDPLKPWFADAAIRSASPKSPHVVCHTQGGLLLVPLIVADVRDARMKIEAAVAMQLAPPAERLEAFPDELIEREAKRRRKKNSKPGEDAPEQE